MPLQNGLLCDRSPRPVFEFSFHASQDVGQSFYPLATTSALPGRLGIIRHSDYRQVLHAEQYSSHEILIGPAMGLSL